MTNKPSIVPPRTADGKVGMALGDWLLGVTGQWFAEAGINGHSIDASGIVGTLPALIAKLIVYINSTFLGAQPALNFSSSFAGVVDTDPTLTNGSAISIDLTTTGITPGVYGRPGYYPSVTYDDQGRAHAASEIALPAGGSTLEVKEVDGAPDVTGVTLLTFPNSTLSASGTAVTFAYNFGTGAGTVCQGNDSRLSDARTPLFSNQGANTVLAGPSSGSPAAPGFRVLVNADLPASGVSAGVFGDGSNVAQVTVNAQGIITSITNVAFTAGSTTFAGLTDVSLTSPAVGDYPVYDGAHWINKPEYVYISVPLSDGTNAVTTGYKGPIRMGVPKGTLIEAYLETTGTSGNVTVDILRAAHGSTSYASIVGAGTKPTIADASSAISYSDTAFTSWTAATFAEGDGVRVNVTAGATLVDPCLILKIKRTP